MSIRIILAIIGVLIVFGIIIDGLWRKKRQERVHRKLNIVDAKTNASTTVKSQTLNGSSVVKNADAVPKTTEPVVKAEVTSLNHLNPRPELAAQQTKQSVKEQLIIEATTIDEPMDDYIILTVLAKKGEKFQGFDLLQALLKAGFKYGKMKLFHRHRDLDNKSPIYFSIASLTKPGYFDIQNMNVYETRGLNLFMSVPDADDATNVFEIMLSAAQQIANRLGGQVCDRHRRPLTKQAIETCQARAKITGNIQQQMQDLRYSDD
jgi:cell division protein ZipA